MKKKKILCAILVLAVMMCSLPANIYAQEVSVAAQGDCGTNVTWTLYSDGLLSIDGEGRMSNFATYVSSQNLNGVSPWKSYAEIITSVRIGENIENIGDAAFYDCENLTDITIPDSVTEIGENALWGTGIETLELPPHLTSIGSDAFMFCRALTSVTIPDSVVQVGDSAFSGCSNLTEVKLSENMTQIENKVFDSCDSLTSVTVPDSVTEIGDMAFSFCSKLAEVKLSENMTKIGSSAFWWCRSLTNVTIPDSVVQIGDSAFSDCENLTEVKLSEHVREIGENAFDTNALLYRFIKYVFYSGTSEQWDSIEIATGNDALTGSPIHFSARGHLWNSEYTVDEEPTCAMTGSKSIHCSVCDVTDEDSKVSIPVSDDHETELRNEKEPTYRSEGYTGDQVCTICEKIIENGKVIPVKERVEATGKFALLKKGLLEKGTKDSNGNPYFQERIPSAEYNNAEVVASITYLDNEAQFEFRSTMYRNNQKTSEIIMRIEENGSQTVTVNYRFAAIDLYAASTFDAKHYTFGGNEYFEQTTLNTMLDNSEIQKQCNTALQSAFNEWNILLLKYFMLDINMADMGFTSYQEAGTHTWDSGRVITNAACETAGTKEYSCMVCGETRTESVPATGHHWDAGIITKEAEAAVDGIRTFTCTACRKTRSETIPATGKSHIHLQKQERQGKKYRITKSGASKGTVELTHLDPTESFVVVPENVTIDDKIYKVTSIAENVFRGNKKITKVTIGKNITKIGKNAFRDCTKLKKITIQTVKLKTKNVGSHAFKNIHKKAVIKIPSKKKKTYRVLLRKRGITGKKQIIR